MRVLVPKRIHMCMPAYLAADELLEDLVLLNSATAFSSSLGGLSSFIAATNLLALFPKDLFAAAQVRV